MELTNKERQIKWLTEYTAIKGFLLDMGTQGTLPQYKTLELIEIADKKYGKYVPKKPHGNTKPKQTTA